MNLVAPRDSKQVSLAEHPRDDNMLEDEKEWIGRYKKRPDMS